MAKAKTRPTGKAVTDFLDSIDHKTRKADGWVLHEMMTRITGCEAEMWGPSIIGFGRTLITYADGRQEPWFAIGFSPRKSSQSLYLLSGKEDMEPYFEKLGKHRQTKGCVYINKLADVDVNILEELLVKSYENRVE